MVRPEALHTSPQVEISAHRNLLVLAWHDAPTVAVMREVARAGRAVAKKHTAGYGLMNLFLRGTPRFTDEVRDEVVRLDRDAQFAPLGAARVILLPGLAGVAVRVFLNTVTLIARPARQVQAFSELAEAAAWLAPKLNAGGQTWAAPDIVTIAKPIIDARQREERGAA
ncbi:Hypothetical protein A7982_11735 [Minicystis rosea]|nr:Hypothetical protein A7982_11735 [Minicystis rosea]